MDRRSVGCEFLGTLLLVFFAVGAAVLSGEYLGSLGIAFAFGLVLAALVHVFGPLSGCHVNPAVTLGMLLCGRLAPRAAAGYWAAQLLGGTAGAALLLVVARQIPDTRIHGAFASNGYGSRSAVGISLGGAFLTELALTFLLVFVVLAVTARCTVSRAGALPIGAALTVVELVGIPLTGASANPARSLGPALVAGGPALGQLWLFFVAPLAGAALAALVRRAVYGSPDRSPGDAAPREGQPSTGPVNFSPGP